MPFVKTCKIQLFSQAIEFGRYKNSFLQNFILYGVPGFPFQPEAGQQVATRALSIIHIFYCQYAELN
jgi:hypothetical protein